MTNPAQQVTRRDLVGNPLRMRPDRIVVRECRGDQALDRMPALNPGHDGSLTTLHANSPRDAISRLETLVLMSGIDLPLRVIREKIASAISSHWASAPCSRLAWRPPGLNSGRRCLGLTFLKCSTQTGGDGDESAIIRPSFT